MNVEDSITLAFHHAADDFISRVMAWFTHGGPTHVALVSPDGEWVIEASSMGRPKGVRIVAFATWARRHPGYELCTVAHPAGQQVWAMAGTQVGKAYDWGWIWGWLLRNKNMQDPERWTCSELIHWAAAETGHPISTLDDMGWHISPRMLRAMAAPIHH